MGRYSCDFSEGEVGCFTPYYAQLQVKWTVDGLASKPYPRGRSKTGFRSTLGG